MLGGAGVGDGLGAISTHGGQVWAPASTRPLCFLAMACSLPCLGLFLPLKGQLKFSWRNYVLGHNCHVWVTATPTHLLRSRWEHTWVLSRPPQASRPAQLPGFAQARPPHRPSLPAHCPGLPGSRGNRARG